MLLASPQRRNNEVIRMKGTRLPGAISFSFNLFEFISGIYLIKILIKSGHKNGKKMSVTIIKTGNKIEKQNE